MRLLLNVVMELLKEMKSATTDLPTQTSHQTPAGETVASQGAVTEFRIRESNATEPPTALKPVVSLALETPETPPAEPLQGTPTKSMSTLLTSLLKKSCFFLPPGILYR